MAAYAQNLNFKPLPPPGNFPQGHHLQVQQQQQQYQQYQQYQQQQQHPQHQQPQQQAGPNGLQRPPSFVGLPPIRRASTFSSSLGLNEEGFLSTDNSLEGAARQQQRQQGTPSPLGPPSQSSMAASQTSQFMSGSQPAGQSVQNVYRPTQGAQSAQNTQGQTQAQTWQLQGQRQPLPGSTPGFPRTVPPGTAALMTPRGVMTPAGNNPAPQMGQGPQFVPGGGRPVALPPHMLPANMMQRFQPQSGWNLQESHLSEPLQPTSRHRHSPSNASSQQPYFGLDKETGVPMTGGLSPQRQKAQQSDIQQPSGQVSGQKDHPFPSQPSQDVSADHQNPANQHATSESPTQLQPQKTQLTRPGVVPSHEGGQGRRGSGIFSSIRDRVAGGHPQERREPEDRPQLQGASNDAASEASILTEEAGMPPQRNPMFGPRGAGPTPDNMSYAQSKDSIVANGSHTPVGERMPPPPSQFAPPGRKLTTFFGIGGTPSPAQSAPSRPDEARTSTSTNTTEPFPAGSIGGLPKKRFSALKDVFHRSPHSGGVKAGTSFTVKLPPQGQLGQQNPPQGQFQTSAQAQPGPFGSGPMQGPANGQTPFGQNFQPQQGAIAENNQGRKPAGGLLGFLRGRADSKSRDTPEQQPGMQSMPFPSSQSPLRGQYGQQVPLGPDGRPLIGTAQQLQPGQSAFQPQYLHRDSPSVPGVASQPGQMAGERPAVPMPQQSGFPQGHQQNTQFTGQDLRFHSQQSPLSNQAGSYKPSNPHAQQSQPALSQPNDQGTPHQAQPKPAEPTPASSAVGSPVSQKSQDIPQFSTEPSRVQERNPPSPKQPMAAPQPVQTRVPNAQGPATPHPAHLLDRNATSPFQAAPRSEQPAPYGSGSEDNRHIDRPVSPSSQPQVTPSSTPAGDIGQGRPHPASPQPDAGRPMRNPEDRVPSRQSFSTMTPRDQASPADSGQGPISQESSQGAGGIQRHPSQRSQQSDPRLANSPQGGQMLPGQPHPTGQSPWMASQASPVPPRQPFNPAAGQNGVGLNAQAKEKEQSTISKLFKGNKSTWPAMPLKEKEKVEKDKGPKSLFTSAFKLGAKGTETPTQPHPAPGLQTYAPSGVQPPPQNMQLQPQQGRPPPNMMTQGPNPQQSISGIQRPPQGQPSTEPQYDQVPIPRGYGYVHAEGRLVPAPAPLYVGPIQNGMVYAPPPGFPQQQWAPIGAASTQTLLGVASNPQAQPSSATQASSTIPSQTPQQAQNQAQGPMPTGPAAQEQGQDVTSRQVTGGHVQPQLAAQPTQQIHPPPTAPLPRAPGVAPSPSSQASTPLAPQSSGAPALQQAKPHPEATRFTSTHSPQQNVPPQPQVQRSAPPQSYIPPNQQGAQGMTQSAGETSADGDLASLPSQRTGRFQPANAASLDASAGLSARSPSASLSPLPTPGRTDSPVPSVQADANISRDAGAVSPEPSVPGPTSPINQLTTPTQRVADDNVYDATPRHLQFPHSAQQQQQHPGSAETIIINTPVEPKSAGSSHEATRPAKPPAGPGYTHQFSGPAPSMQVPSQIQPRQSSTTPDLGSSDSDLESPIIQDATIATLQKSPSSGSANNQSSAADAAAKAKDSVAIFERAKRKAEEQREAERRLVLEEKIPVFPSEPEDDARRKEEEAVPQMSATSYPGQEWNPYGEGGFEDWE